MAFTVYRWGVGLQWFKENLLQGLNGCSRTSTGLEQKIIVYRSCSIDLFRISGYPD